MNLIKLFQSTAMISLIGTCRRLKTSSIPSSAQTCNGSRTQPDGVVNKRSVFISEELFKEQQKRLEDKLNKIFETRYTKEFDNTKTEPAIQLRYKQLLTHGKVLFKNNEYALLHDEYDGMETIGIAIYDKQYKKYVPKSFITYKIIPHNNKKYIGINLIHTLKSDSLTSYIIKLFSFLKNRYNMSIIDISGFQSEQARRFLSILSKRHKNVYWWNVVSKEKLPYNTKNVEFMRDDGKTDWRILIENQGTRIIEDDLGIDEEYMNILYNGLRKT